MQVSVHVLPNVSFFFDSNAFKIAKSQERNWNSHLHVGAQTSGSWTIGKRQAQDGEVPPASYDPSPPQPLPHSCLTVSFLLLYQPPSFLPQGIYIEHLLCQEFPESPSLKDIFTGPSACLGLQDIHHNHNEVTTSIVMYVTPAPLSTGSSKKSKALFVFFSTIILGI